MQRFNTKQFRKGSALSPLIKRVIFTALGVIALFFIIRAVMQNARIMELRAERVKEFTQSKRSLIVTIDELNEIIDSFQAALAETQLLRDENMKLKEEFNREGKVTGTLARVLTPANRSFYDTMIIDAGSAEGIMEGQIAYAFDSVALGTISNVETHKATVLLFSASDQVTPGTTVGSDVTISLIGRGNGEYEVRMPRDVHFNVGDAISYQSIDMVVLATIEKIVTDPRDPFQRLLAKAPINLTTVKWVVIR